jgi:putative protein-disulfide isomerase
MADKNIVEIIEFTDPVCTWCWGSEPLLRTLEARYGEQLKVRFVMGGLVEDITQFYDSAHQIGGDPERSNISIAAHWLEASERHGMPVRADGFRLFSAEQPSTYPQNIAYKAAQMESQELADKFLRRIREATAAEARQTNQQEVLIELATEVGLDLGKFLERIADGSAENAFRSDLSLVRQYGVRGFPTFLIKYGVKETLIRSYQNYESFRVLITTLSGGIVKESIPAKTDKNILDFIIKYGRVAPVEIEMAFGLVGFETKAIIERLAAASQIKQIPVGNGKFIEPAGKPLECDPVTGVCKA